MKTLLVCSILGISAISLSACQDPQAYHADKTAAENNYDSALANRVRNTLAQDDRIPYHNITVQSDDSNIILSGFVDTQYQADIAKQLALNTVGVHRIYNHLVVRKPNQKLIAQQAKEEFTKIEKPSTY